MLIVVAIGATDWIVHLWSIQEVSAGEGSGNSIDVTLTFEQAGVVTMNMPVVPYADDGRAAPADHQHGGG